MTLGETPRIFDHTKQYVCTEIFRLEALQQLVLDMEALGDDDLFDGDRKSRRDLLCEFSVAAETINEFLKNLEEQERRK